MPSASSFLGRLLPHAEDRLEPRQEARDGRSSYFAYGASCSEVTIDTMTGEMKVDRVDILHDVGKSLNPAIDIGQIEGGFVQGMGWLTTEELVWDEPGPALDPRASTYKIPAASDMPEHFTVELFQYDGERARTRSIGPRRWASCR